MALTGLAVFALIAALLYARLITTYLYHWNRLEEKPLTDSGELEISVVIPARNEAAGLRACLGSVAAQNYPQEKYEVIVVDDHSTDATREIIGEFPDVRLVSLAELAGDGQGKKAALAAGIHEARGDIVVMTDADCIASPEWLAALSVQFADGVSAVTGPVCYHHMSGLLEHFQALEILGLMVVTGGGLAAGRHHLGNGANMAIRRTVFEEVGGYRDNTHLASGDDLFLLEAIAGRYPGSLRYVKMPEAIVRTTAQSSWHHLVRQRLRWASKNAALKDRAIRLTWTGIWVIHLLLLVSVLLVPRMPLMGVLIVVAAIVVKAYADHRILSAAAFFTGQEKVLRWFIPAFVLNFLYVLYMGVVSLMTQRYEWKERRLR